MSHRMHLDNSIQLIGKLLFGIDSSSDVLKTVRPAGQPLVDDWLCLKTLVISANSTFICICCFCVVHPNMMTGKWLINFYAISLYILGSYLTRNTCLLLQVRTFEAHCGSLSQYGMKHMRSIANICNAGISKEQMSDASAQACVTFPSNPWSSVSKGFTAWFWTHLMAVIGWLHLQVILCITLASFNSFVQEQNLGNVNIVHKHICKFVCNESWFSHSLYILLCYMLHVWPERWQACPVYMEFYEDILN